MREKFTWGVKTKHCWVLSITWIFTEGEGDGIQAIFLNLFYFNPKLFSWKLYHCTEVTLCDCCPTFFDVVRVTLGKHPKQTGAWELQKAVLLTIFLEKVDPLIQFENNHGVRRRFALRFAKRLSTGFWYYTLCCMSPSWKTGYGWQVCWNYPKQSFGKKFLPYNFFLFCQKLKITCQIARAGQGQA